MLSHLVFPLPFPHVYLVRIYLILSFLFFHPNRGIPHLCIFLPNTVDPAGIRVWRLPLQFFAVSLSSHNIPPSGCTRTSAGRRWCELLALAKAQQAGRARRTDPGSTGKAVGAVGWQPQTQAMCIIRSRSGVC